MKYFEKDMELDRYARKAISLIERGKKIVIPVDFKQKTQELDKEGDKNITFLVDRPKYESALAEVINALELLSQIDISCIPVKNMKNIVKLLLAICTDCNKKVQNLHDTMAIMAKYIHEFMTLGHKADTLDSYKLKLEGDIQKLILENSNLKGEVIRIQNIITSQMGIGPVNVNNNEKDAEIEHLKGKLNEMFERKEYYKKRTNDNQASLDNSLRATEEELEKSKQVNQQLLNDLTLSSDKLMEAEQEIRDKEETYRNYVEKTNDERNRMLEVYETASVESNNEITRLKIEILKKEEEALKARRFYNKRMREVDNQLTETKEKVIEQKKEIKI